MSSLAHSGFLSRATLAPNATALVDATGSVTYGELERASRRLAWALQERGVRGGDRVALLLPRSSVAIAAVLGVLRAGAAYVPIDAQSPAARRRAILRNASPACVVTTREELPGLAEEETVPGEDAPPVLLLDPAEGLAAFGTSPAAPPTAAPSPRSPACILYTSGSTGTPKGVIHSHEGIAAFAGWALRRFELSPEDRVANVTELTFDLSVFDLFATLSAGGAVHVVTRADLLRPGRVIERLDERGITLLYSVPSTLALLAEQPELARRPLTTLSRVLYAGEPYAVPRLRTLMRALPGARIHNLFGPTETNVCLAYSLPATLPRDTTAVPIGTPCDHLYVTLLDPRGQPVAVGDEGEVCVAGPSVLLGYHGLSDRSGDDFWPAGTLPGLPALFRTGDHARRDADGLYWFAGRRDRLVKHRGYRIDLGEIEAALAMVPGVRESAVTTVPDGRGGIEIRAHVAPAGGVDLTVLAVKSHCGRHLPPYMVPATVAIVPELPRTATGKLDLLRLR